MAVNELRRGAAEWLRESAGRAWTWTALAKKARVSRQTIYNVLNEEADPEEETIARLATAMGLSAPSLDDLAHRGVHYVQSADRPPAGRQGSEATFGVAARSMLEVMRRQIDALEVLLLGTTPAARPMDGLVRDIAGMAPMSPTEVAAAGALKTLADEQAGAPSRAAG